MTVCSLALGAAHLAGGGKGAVPDYAWSFPRDHWAHDGYRTEWWYLTGQLARRSTSRVGAGVNVAKGLHVRLDLQTLGIDEDVLNAREDTSLDSILLEFQYRFGAH